MDAHSTLKNDICQYFLSNDLGDWDRNVLSDSQTEYFLTDPQNCNGLYNVTVTNHVLRLTYTVFDFSSYEQEWKWTDDSFESQIERAFQVHPDFCALLYRRNKLQPNLGDLECLPVVTVPKKSSKVFKVKLGAFELNWMFSVS